MSDRLPRSPPFTFPHPTLYNAQIGSLPAGMLTARYNSAVNNVMTEGEEGRYWRNYWPVMLLVRREAAGSSRSSPARPPGLIRLLDWR